jgi:hypothetical protein
MHALQISFFSGLAALTGILFAWWIEAKSFRSRLQGLERNMTAKIAERYSAYLGLEAQVTRAIQQFDRCEYAFTKRLAERNRAIAELERALDAYQGKRSAPHVADRAGEQEAPAVRAPAHALAEELAAFEEKLLRLQQAKEAEIERQLGTIGALTERIQKLEPLDHALSQRNAELYELRRAHAALEQESTQRIEVLSARVTALEPLEES